MKTKADFSLSLDATPNNIYDIFNSKPRKDLSLPSLTLSQISIQSKNKTHLKTQNAKIFKSNKNSIQSNCYLENKEDDSTPNPHYLNNDLYDDENEDIFECTRFRHIDEFKY